MPQKDHSGKMVLSSAEKPSSTSLCSVFISFKSLLVFIYEIINAFMSKLSGKAAKSQSTGYMTKNGEIVMKIGINHEFEISNKSKFGKAWIAPQPRVKEIWEMPGPRPIPFFGTLLTSSALKSSDLMRVNEDREKMYGPIVKEEHFWNFPLVMILGTEEIKKIVRMSPIIRPGMEILTLYRSLRPDRYNSFGLVNSQGNIWKHLHSTFSTVASSIKFVRTLLPVFNEITDDVVASLADETTPTNVLPRALNKLITEASFYAVFGKRMGFVGNDVKVPDNLRLFSNCHDIYWKAFHKSMYGFPWWKYFPTKVWNDFTSAEDKMMNMISEITENLLADGSAGGILDAVQKDRVTKQDLNVVLLELITGATEPVFHAVIITLYWISKHEQVYKRVFEELQEQMPTKDACVDENVLNNIPYLKACVTETFRICPTTCNLARMLDTDLQLGDYKIPAYTPLILQTWHACLKETSFYRAKEYLPERWLLEDGVPPFRPHERQVMCNFGIGIRACPGRKIATQLINTFLCKILRKYKVKFTEDIDLRYEWLLVVKEPIVVELKEHEY